MKNTIKISIMSGLVTAGVLLCGVHIANAQTNIDSGYTVLIPSEVTIDKESGKGSFSVSGKMDAQTELDVTTTSQNNYKLKCGSQFVDYTLDKQSFHIDNIKSANPKNFNEDFNITLANTNTNYSGPYKDRLAFNIQCHKYTYELDMNSILDGVRENECHNYGAVDVYINGVLKAENVSDFKEILNYGDTYEFKNIKATDGHHFVGINSCANTSIKGRIGADTNYLETRRDNPYNLVAPIYFEFNTNKLTINYHADGAQTWIHFDSVTYDVSGKDAAGSETHLFGSYYDEKHGLGDVRRLTKKGYTAKPNTWIVGKNGTKEVSDNVGLAKSQDVAEYCGVLDEFKKNDTVIDLYPIWTPIQSQLNLNANGGTFSDNSTFKTATDKLVYDSTANVNISSYTPTRKGYDFDGWYTDEAGGTKVYNADGSAVNGTQYWQNNVYQNTEGSNVVVDIKNEIYPIVYYNGQSHSNITIANLGWSEDQTLASKIANNIYFTSNIPDNFDGGIYYMVFESYCRRTGVSLADLKNKRIRLTVKMKADKKVSFTNYPGLECTSSSRKNINISKEWNTYVFEGAPEDKWTDNGRHAFVLYGPSEKDFTLSIGDFNIQFDTDVELFAHWTKKNYSTGTVLNIEGSDYIVMSQIDDDNYLLLSGTSIGNIQYQPNQDSSGNYKLNVSDEPDKKRYDGQNSNTYENSYIDRYLENTWYKNLPASMQKAIQETKIKQVSYTDSTTNPKWKFFDPEGGTNKYWYYNEGDEIEPNWVIYDKAKIPDNESGTYPYRYWSQKDAFDNEIYNSISKHVFLPCVEDIYNIVDLNNANKIRDFLNSTDNHLNYMWLRDAYSNSSQTAIYLDYNTRSMDNYYVTSKAMGIRPAFVIDLSKVDYTVTGTVNYK